ncbi:MAG: hypothetical protein KJ905_01660 [Nanoarchaeota archaeon]|nr:hypothetical protein [Nanoarchaeota archaeon]MBU1501460.1 hypothetical protein [Nanoarchaeota archaeon]MBU2459346.1 hypothetical protein [Nanoarchaeota archaeon]
MNTKYKIKNKNGVEILSVYWFAILFIVAAGIVYMVYSFYGQPYDVRETEADALTTLVARCLTDAGYVTDGILLEGVLNEDFKGNFLSNCNLNFDVEDAYGWQDSGQFYLEVNFFNFDSGTSIGEISEGNSGLKSDCGQKGKNLPVCVDRDFYVIDKDNNQYKINVISVVRKTEKNVQ